MITYEELLKENSADIQEFKKPFIEIVFEEVNFLLNNYKWNWNEEDLCYYNEYDDDVADCVYYDCDGYLIHPKVLATYVEDYLRFGQDKKMIWNYDLK